VILPPLVFHAPVQNVVATWREGSLFLRRSVDSLPVSSERGRGRERKERRRRKKSFVVSVDSVVSRSACVYHHQKSDAINV